MIIICFGSYVAHLLIAVCLYFSFITFRKLFCLFPKGWHYVNFVLLELGKSFPPFFHLRYDKAPVHLHTPKENYVMLNEAAPLVLPASITL